MDDKLDHQASMSLDYFGLNISYSNSFVNGTYSLKHYDKDKNGSM